MITKNSFVTIIKKIQEYERFLDKICNYIQLEKFDELFIPGEVQDEFFKSIASEREVDLINAYLYDREDFNTMVDGVDTPEELYDYLMK